MKLNAVLAFGIVAGMALFWHLVITCWQSKCQTGQIGRGLLLFTVMVFLVFAGLFLTECMAFYESLSKSGTDPFGNVISGKSHREALITIGSWVSVNFLIGFITGFCAYHITRKE